MSLVPGRTYLDADSHIMELPDFMTSQAPKAKRELVPDVRVNSGINERDIAAADTYWASVDSALKQSGAANVLKTSWR